MKNKPIPFSGENCSVFGITRSGKSYSVHKSLLERSEGTFFWNVQHDAAFSKGFITATMRDDFGAIQSALSSGEKINYLPSTEADVKDREFATIVEGFYEHKGHKLFLVADEAHLLRGPADKALVRVVTTGLSWGITTITISQRAATMNYTAITQSPQRIFFDMDTLEMEYFRAKKFPVDEIMRVIHSGGEQPHKPHESPYLGNYAVYSRGVVDGPYRV